ncbi:MAG: dihydroorotate dehydrogenase electron transfer subunit, partial [Clostridia bacterium]|nr:dihydroorotate dehydrogenase electron transfer subunit [Clostridia bacterium]
MKQVYLTIEKNEKLTRDVLRLTLTGDASGVTNPGQFVNIAIDGFYLRRPISVCDKEDGKITLIYKVVGDGTRALSGAKEGTVLDTLTGLGNGYSLSKSGEKPLLIGGGVGIPPLFWLCRELLKNGVSPSVILGFNTAEEIFLEDEFRALGVPVT